MPKTKSVFFCQNCGYESSKWMGQCPACKEWNSFAEEPKIVNKKTTSGVTRRETAAKPRTLSEIELSTESRVTTGMGEFDRVLGGGIVQGSLVLVGGDPGIGKSTLLLQMCRNLAANGKRVLYVSGEESPQQIRMRAQRMGVFSDNLKIFCETNLADIREMLSTERPDIAIIDSIQTMYHEE
ncbi:MAG: AAA family ATPase, partial [Lachnospiraceae bacterium]|nr:AAA family ATPase [Lachnospiraceae bacterium]